MNVIYLDAILEETEILQEEIIKIDVLNNFLISIDTNILIKYHYDFSNTYIKKLISFLDSNKDKLNYYIGITEVNHYENIAHFSDKIKETQNSILQGYKSISKYLNSFTEDQSKQFHIPTDREEFNNPDKIAEEILKKFYSSLASPPDYYIIPPEEVSISDLVKAYFKGAPPFSAKKKEEFPDAISLLSLQNFVKETDDVVIYISADKGIQSFIEQNNEKFIHFESINKFLDVANISINSLSNTIKNHLLEYNLDYIFEQVQEYLSGILDTFFDFEFTNSLFVQYCENGFSASLEDLYISNNQDSVRILEFDSDLIQLEFPTTFIIIINGYLELFGHDYVDNDDFSLSEIEYEKDLKIKTSVVITFDMKNINSLEKIKGEDIVISDIEGLDNNFSKHIISLTDIVDSHFIDDPNY